MSAIEMERNEHEWQVARVTEQFIAVQGELYDDPNSEYLKALLEVTRKQLRELGIQGA